VPLSWKDNCDSAGVATEAGTAMMAGRVPLRDATVLETATLGGAVCLGKTHMVEIAFSGLGYNPVMGTPPNRHDPDALPGGSSSGAAASVAYGLAPAAIGSDTGGSVRLPAAWNDLVGFKPTHGILPLTGVVPLSSGFDTLGPLARSVTDCANLLALLGGTKPPDLTGASLQGARLLILDTIVGTDLDPAPAAAFDGALARLTKAGARVSHASFADLPRAYDLSGIVSEAWAFWRPYVLRDGDKMFPLIRERVSAGADVSAADYITGWEELRAIRARFAALIAGFDAVVCATCPILPPKVASVANDPEVYKATNMLVLRNTRMGNLMGLSAISLPTGQPSCGIMLHAGPGQDARLLRLARAAEIALA
jgi:aspartyl-tRNA(Asn)/glutamyl-tRNA(Gln) amidotransferase subunit A